MGKYDDIIDLPHPISENHPQMSMLERAAQFSPFAALSGHGDAIKETARLTDAQRDLDEDAATELNRTLREVLKLGQPEVEVTCFQPDERKAGGRYAMIRGQVKRIDDIMGAMALMDGRRIPLDTIVGITIL